MKKYFTDCSNNIIIDVLIYLSILLTLFSLIFLVFGNLSILSIFIILDISDLICFGIIYSAILCNGYSVNNDKLYSYFNMNKYEHNLHEINNVIISNSYVGGRYGGATPKYIKNHNNIKVIRPWITFVFDSKDIEDCIYKNINGEMNSFIIQTRWLKGKQILGFEYNKHVINDLLNNYQGKIYLAKTVANNFEYEITKYLSNGSLTKEQIVLLDDIYENINR